MINLNSLAKLSTTAKSLSDLILVTPNKPTGYQPQAIESLSEGKTITDQNGYSFTVRPPEAFFFNYEGEQSISLTSDITDHYLEDNTAISDQISNKPEEITTNGFIGELNDIVPPGMEVANLIAEKLVLLGGYTPELSRTALNAYNAAKFAYDSGQAISNNAVQTWESLTGNTPLGKSQTKQQKAFQKFYGYRAERRLFTVQTPWAIFSDMAIKSLKSVQSGDSDSVSNFEITFKKMRFASISVAVSRGTLGGVASNRAATQSAPQTNMNVSTPSNDKGFPYAVS